MNEILVAWFHFENQLGIFFFLLQNQLGLNVCIYLFLFKIEKNHKGHAM